MATFYGFNPPFLGGRQNVLSRQVDEQLIKNDLLQLILTGVGERVMRPDFGTRVRTMLFEPITQQLLLGVQNEIVRAISENDSRVILRDVSVVKSGFRNGVDITIVFSLKTDPFTKLQLETFVNGGTST